MRAAIVGIALVMLSRCSAFTAFTSGARLSTVTVSPTAPTVRAKVRRTVCADVNSVSVAAYVLNPGASMRIV